MKGQAALVSWNQIIVPKILSLALRQARESVVEVDDCANGIDRIMHCDNRT
jgi:hypothetical protein